MHLTNTGLELIDTFLSNKKKITNFTMPIEHKINFTPYWLLGFIVKRAVSYRKGWAVNFQSVNLQLKIEINFILNLR